MPALTMNCTKTVGMLSCFLNEQHLRIKKFYGRTENAVKTQIWIAISVYVLIAIIRKRMNLDVSLSAKITN